MFHGPQLQNAPILAPSKKLEFYRIEKILTFSFAKQEKLR